MIPAPQSYDVVLHIGAPKTGSSALQNFFLNNREQLVNAGYYYPVHGSDSNGISGGHSKLGISVRDKQLVEATACLKEYLDEAKAKNKVLLLSAESFYPFPSHVRPLMEGLKCRVICFFRDPAEFQVSIYNQSVKRHHNTEKLESFCRRVLNTKQHQASGLVLYDWVELFGMDNISVLRYQKPQSADTQLEKLFLSELGVNEEQQAEFSYNTKPINMGYNESVLEFKRRLNHVTDKDDKPQNGKIDRILQSISDNQSSDRIGNTATQVLKQTYEMLNAKFKDSNDKISKDFFEGQSLFQANELEVDQEKSSFSLLHFAEYIQIIKELDIEVDSYIRSSIEKKLHSETADYYVMSLADAYGISLTGVRPAQSNTNPPQDGFGNAFVKQVLQHSGNANVLLRVIAVALEKQGRLGQAMNVIKKTSQGPQSEAMQIVRARIKKKLDALSKNEG